MSQLLSHTYGDVQKVMSVILGGGEGSRLFPLTKERAKPAVPLAGKYRFIDIPISLSINSGIKRIFLLTQYQSSSLHRHIQQAYHFDTYAPQGFVEILAAEKDRSGKAWYTGTADSVRQNFIHLDNHHYEQILILSGDHLYRMDYRNLIAHHNQSGADVTVATIPVCRSEAGSFGIMHIDESSRIIRFDEKPQTDSLLDALYLPQSTLVQLNKNPDEKLYLASMGIYLFNKEVLKDALRDGSRQDFGKHVIPGLLEEGKKVMAYIHQGYWEDIGTIRAYYEASLDLVNSIPKFDFYDQDSPIYTRGRYLPASKVNKSRLHKVLLADGCIINNADIANAIIGIRSHIDTEVTIRNSIILGADNFETAEDRAENERLGRPHLGIGQNCFIEGAIIDKQVRIGKDVVIRSEGKTENIDSDLYHVRDGIVVIPKSAVIPDGTII